MLFVCQGCGIEFSTAQSNRVFKHAFCSWICFQRDQERERAKARKSLPCACGCGAEIIRPPSKVVSDNAYLNREHYLEHRRRIFAEKEKKASDAAFEHAQELFKTLRKRG